MLNGLLKPVECPFESGALALFENFMDRKICEGLYNDMLLRDHWNNAKYTVSGREFSMPRVQTWYADRGIVYNFQYGLHQQRDWTPALARLKRKIELFTGQHFNSVLINWYRDGKDWVDWHSDDEIELGADPLIASISLGSPRRFCYRRKSSLDVNSVALTDGSLLMMYPEFQHLWQHCIAKENKIIGPRLNFTFRNVIMP